MTLLSQSSELKLGLRRSFQVVPVNENELYVYNAKGTSYHFKTESVNLLQIFHALMRGITKSELRSSVVKSRDIDVVNQLIERLIESRILQQIVPPNELTETELDRFDREIGYFANFETSTTSRYDYMKRLRNAHVLMIGLGSLGSWVLQHFIACGVGRITGVDMDTIESSNLARQSLYHEADICKSKVKAAAHAVKALSSFTDFSGIQCQVNSCQDIQKLINKAGDLNLIVLTADVPIWKISCWAAEAALSNNLPLLRANRFGVGPFMIPGKTACPACAWSRIVEEIPDAEQMVEYQRSIQGMPAAALSIQPSISGALLVEEAIAYLSGAGTVRTYNSTLNVKSNSDKCVTTSPFSRDLHCHICGESSLT
jgi:molybdopterin/thiamine biosynthesis adenylyltransferase